MLFCHSYSSFNYGTIAPDILVQKAKAWSQTSLVMADILNVSENYCYVVSLMEPQWFCCKLMANSALRALMCHEQIGIPAAESCAYSCLRLCCTRTCFLKRQRLIIAAHAQGCYAFYPPQGQAREGAIVLQRAMLKYLPGNGPKA